MHVTILGTTGQLATELWQRARAAGMTLGEHVRVDVTDHSALRAHLERSRPDLVINATAYTAVDRAETDVAQAFAVNDEAVGVLANWCATNAAALLHVSTDYVFDGGKQSPYVETDVPAPLGAYGRSKLAGERRIGEALPSHVILRTSWVFSAHGQNFVKTMVRLAQERPELRVVADQRGRPTSAAHLAEALLKMAARFAEQRTLPWGTFHFAGDEATTWFELAQAVIAEQSRLTQRTPTVLPISTKDFPTAAVRPQNSELDTTAFEQAFGPHRRSWREELSAIVPQLVSALRT